MLDTGPEHEVIHLLDEFLVDMLQLDLQTTLQNAAMESIKSKAWQGFQRPSTVQKTAKTTAAPQKKKIHSWLRKKLELEALRQQTEELETRVAFLKLEQEKRRLRLGLSREQLSRLYNNKRGVDKELVQLRAAQEENAALKRNIRACIQVSSSFQEALNCETEALHTVLPMKAIQSVLEMGILQQLQLSSPSTFNELEERVNTRFQGYQAILDSFQLASVTLDEDQMQVYSGNDDTPTVMEYTCTRVLPFDERDTFNAVWGVVEEGGIPQKQVSNVVRRSKDAQAVDSRFVLLLEHGETVTMDVHCVVKRFKISEGYVLVVEGNSESLAYRDHSIAWRQESQESAWCVVCQYPHIGCGRGSFLGSKCQGVARSEVCHSHGSDCTSAFVHELALSSFRELIDSQRQYVENLLWDSVRAPRKEQQ